VAITLLCVIGLVVGISLGLAFTPINAFAFLGTLDALFIILIYILVNVACMRFFWRKRRAQFGWIRHGILPSLGALITTGIFVAAFISPGNAPLSYIPFVVVAWLALGLIVLFAIRKQFGAATTAATEATAAAAVSAAVAAETPIMPSGATPPSETMP